MRTETSHSTNAQIIIRQATIDGKYGIVRTDRTSCSPFRHNGSESGNTHNFSVFQIVVRLLALMRHHLWNLGMNSVQIEENYAVKHSFLRERVAHGKRPGTREFVALSEGVEAGLLIFEHFPSTSLGFVYEIFVLKEFRGLGIGNLLLSQAEDVALESACTMLHLTARSLDQEFIKDDDLKSWYRRKGFIQNNNDSGDMLKRLTGECKDSE